MTRPDDIAGLQALVAAEHAAVFGIAAMGGRLAGLDPRSPGVGDLRLQFDVHRSRRDAWTAALVARNAAAPPSAAAYVLPPLGSAEGTLAAAAALEGRMAAAYAAALSQLGDPTLRTQVTAALTDVARQQYALGTFAGQPPATAAPPLPGG
ncbi:MAG TPA: DUF4439 domain-containing protein [Mycobacteriales bacterium]